MKCNTCGTDDYPGHTFAGCVRVMGDQINTLKLQIDDWRKSSDVLTETAVDLRAKLEESNRLLDETREALRELIHGVEDNWNHSGRCSIGTPEAVADTPCDCGADDLIDEPLRLLARIRPSHESKAPEKRKDVRDEGPGCAHCATVPRQKAHGCPCACHTFED